MSITLKPIHDRVVIKRESEKTTAAGLLLPYLDKNDIQVGKVLAIGPEVKYVNVGDDVISVRVLGVKYDGIVIIKEPEILAVVEA